MLPSGWFSNGILLCSTGNSITYGGTCNVRKKECIHLCVTGSPCCTVEKIYEEIKKIKTKQKTDVRVYLVLYQAEELSSQVAVPF